jgi:hypothetical protein
MAERGTLRKLSRAFAIFAYHFYQLQLLCFLPINANTLKYT